MSNSQYIDSHVDESIQAWLLENDIMLQQAGHIRTQECGKGFSKLGLRRAVGRHLAAQKSVRPSKKGS